MPDSQSTAPHFYKRITLFALGAGLFAAWWGAFHEVVCGFMLIGTDMDSVYAYAGCYAHSIGCILGALLSPFVVGRLLSANRRRGMLVLVGIELALTAAVFFCLGIHSPLAPVLLQIPVNALACIAALFALETLARFTFKEMGSVLVSALCSYALVNYALFPALIRLPFGLQAIMCAEIILLAAAGIAIGQFYRLSAETDKLPDPTVWETFERRTPVSDRAFAWQPACFLAAYGMAFGFMHVEASWVIRSLPERSVFLLLGIACATVIVSLFILKLNERESVWRYYRAIVFPLLLCAFLMLQERTIDVSAVSVALAYASMSTFFLLTVLACVRISAETALPLVRVGRMAVGVCYGFVLVGMSVNNYVTFALGADALNSPIVAVVALVMLSAATFWIGDDRNVAKVWGKRIEKDPRSTRNEEFERDIARFSESYNLTPKEQTILMLLAKGKRANQISEELFVSVNTVRTHIRNVYNKLDVHSYQDLMKKLEEEQVTKSS